MFFREAPDAIKAAGVEALLVDQVSPGGKTVAELLDKTDWVTSYLIGLDDLSKT